MPGTLPKNARCPSCRTPILGVVRTSNLQGVTVEYFHEKGWHGRQRISPKARRIRRCKIFYRHPVPKGVFAE